MSPLYTPDDRTSRTDDERIADITPLPPPEHLIRFFPIKGTPMEKLVLDTRHAIRNIVAGQDPRILVVVGPCSIHDPGGPGSARRPGRRSGPENGVRRVAVGPGCRGRPVRGGAGASADHP